MFGKRNLKKNKADSINNKELEEQIVEAESQMLDVAKSDNREDSYIPKIRTEILPNNAISDGSNLVEIRDSKLIARIDNLIPGFFHVGNSLTNVSNAIRSSGGKIYKAIIPSGATLSKSTNMEGAVRGIYQSANGKIAGHANLVEVTQKGAPVLANSLAAAMGVASMVVGQYYMTQINDKLEEIGKDVSKISDFQNEEFESKVSSLLALVKSEADFQIENLENNDTRQIHRNIVENYQATCAQLLNQSCLHIENFISKNKNIKFEDYEKKLPDIQKWFMYQNALFEILNKISELRYALSLGEMSREQCTATLSLYKDKVSESQTRLRRWHEELCSQFKININTKQKKKKGVSYLPGIIKDDWKYKSIKESMANLIIYQMTARIPSYDNTNLFSEDVQIVAKDNKLYYVSPVRAKDENDDYQSMFEKYMIDD